ncbi:hypothetical protein RE476_09205 [Methanolobus mangrovi]|uniref:Uncharacterized protein n=1 Tax=Methanolobus mangrovi TaxID=3072977 RepID=A0AA51UEN1_9EURY|nr:hypothetical protein [Methanolobus mangrovi]WMW21564.1 hypothetical protein RE476_09205 [Methanolobus mangrovi]
MIEEMKFIERLFGKKQEIEEPRSVVFDFEKLPGTVKDEIKRQEDVLRPVVKEKYESIRQALRELEKLKKELLAAEPIEGASKRGEKLGDSNRDNVANNLKLIDSKLKVPGNTSPATASEFYTDAKSTLKNVLDNTRKSLLYIKALYPREHQKINQGLADLEDSLDELYSSIMEGNERVSELQKIAGEMNTIERVNREIEQSTKKIVDLDTKYESAKSKLSGYDSKLTGLENSSEFERAKQLETEIRILDAKIADVGSEARRLFTPLSKAISRMEKQDENERCVLSPENRKTLKTINEDPASAIEYDLGPFLSELTGRIESGELGLKDQMCDKALKQIQVLEDSKTASLLVEQRKKYLSDREAFIQELNGLSIYQEKEDIEREIENHHSLSRSVNNDIQSERKHLDGLKEELEMTKSVLISDLRHFYGDSTLIEYKDN